MMRKKFYFPCRSSLFLFLWALVLSTGAPDLSFGAAEGTARLTFQKEVPVNNKERVYIVRHGDTITHIVRKLGWPAPRRFLAIKQLNPDIPDLNKIYPGQKLLLPRLEEQQPDSDAGAAPEIVNYRAKEGDSLARIIASELRAGPAEAVRIFGTLKRLNPGITNLNKIYPGQVIKVPRSKDAAADRGNPDAPTPVQAGEEEQTLTVKAAPTYKALPVIRHVVEQLKGTVVTSGSHYIPLPESGQVVVDCGIVPVIEMADGTTILLDFARRLPDGLAAMIRAHWKNYHVVTIAKDRNAASILQEILLASPSWRMAKATAPLSFDDLPQVKLTVDWLITAKTSSVSGFSQLGLIFATDKAQLLPSPAIVKYALKKGTLISEIFGDKVQAGMPDAAEVAPLTQIKGGGNEEFLSNVLIYLGAEPLPHREVKIFDSRKDGFDLAVKPESLFRMGGKTILIVKSKLPQQFNERLKQEGMTAVTIVPGAAKIAVLEGVLTALDIPYQVALYSVPPPQEKTRVTISFPALKIAREKGFTYLIDFGMDKEIYEFLTRQWKLNIVRY